MLQILLSLFFIGISFFSLKPYLKNPAQRKTLIRVGLILLPLSLLGYLAVTYINSKPDSFERGVEMLKSNKEIQSKIGDFDSYTFFEENLPKKEDNPASFKVELQGSQASVYLTCKIKRDTLGRWHFLKIKQDSLKKTAN